MSQTNITPMDIAQLYRMDTYSDNKAGKVTECVPVTFAEDGRVVQDPIRTIIYIGETKLIRGGQMQDLGFYIPAKDLKEAAERFAVCCQGKIDEIESAMIQQRLTAGIGQQQKGLVIDGGRKKK